MSKNLQIEKIDAELISRQYGKTSYEVAPIRRAKTPAEDIAQFEEIIKFQDSYISEQTAKINFQRKHLKLVWKLFYIAAIFAVALWVKK